MKNILTTTDSNLTRTPIEIALNIDENGMTTASNLYEFLELDSSHFARWCSKNIVNNKFASREIDYFPFAMEGDRHNPKPRTDYKITADFAKKLSMTGNTERHEQARQYFLACEQGLKVATRKLQSITDTNDKIIDLLTSMDARLGKLEEQNEKHRIPAKKYSRWKSNTFKKLSALRAYINEKYGENLELKNVIHRMIEETEDAYNVEFNEYAEMYRCEFGMEYDEKVQVIDVINHYKDIRDKFTAMLDSFMEKLGIMGNARPFKSGDIFDELTAKTYKATAKYMG